MARRWLGELYETEADTQRKDLAMAESFVFSVDLAGEWSDAWLYKDHLILWSRTNRMYQITLEALTKYIEAEHGGPAATVAEYALFRNDWKNSAAFRSIRRIPDLARAFELAVSEFRRPLEIRADLLPLLELETEPADGILLDTAIYANRVYSASTEGLFESRVKLKLPDYPHHQRQLLDKRVSCVSVKYAAVNASAGEDGLWFHPIEWGRDGEPEFDFDFDDERGDPWGVRVSERVNITKIADISNKNSFSSRHLLNYTEDWSPQFIPALANKERPHSEAQFADWRIFGFGDPIDISRDVQETISASLGDGLIGGAEGSGISVLGNSNYRLLVGWRNHLRVVDIGSSPTQGNRIRLKIKIDKNFAELTDQPVIHQDVLETYAFGSGFLVELYDEVRLLTKSGSQQFFAGEVASMRTFRDSLRYQEVAAIIHEDGVRLGGYYTLP